MEYQSRIADAQLADMLAGLPAVLIEGVRAVGKTETARRVCADEMLLDDPNVYEMVRDDPFKAVTGWRDPLLVDGAVINTGPFAHRRQDGIAVIPLALLGP